MASLQKLFESLSSYMNVLNLSLHPLRRNMHSVHGPYFQVYFIQMVSVVIRSIILYRHVTKLIVLFSLIAYRYRECVKVMISSCYLFEKFQMTFQILSMHIRNI